MIHLTYHYLLMENYLLILKGTTEVYPNGYASYRTGCGSTSATAKGLNTCVNAYGSSTSYPQSTTGNIYGIYDMSGGAWEYVMGAYGTSTPTIGNSGFGSTVFTGNTIESKYYNIYKTNDVLTACDNNGPCLGHAMSETASWYGDYSNMVSSSFPWFVRGDLCISDSGAGVFYHSYANGLSGSDYSARVVGFGK